MTATAEQWTQYQKDLAQHELVIRQKELHYSFVCEWLQKSVVSWEEDWREDPLRMCKVFKRAIQAELEKARHMDAPNKPGYEFANND